MKNNKPGFTLIELLVVIAIIGLLSTLSIVALNSARAKSRDARRVSDIKQIQTALELYYNENNSYPATLTTAGMPDFLTKVPVAPTPNDGSCSAAANTYVYTPVTGSGGITNGSYTLTYCIGDTTGGIPGGAVQTATPAGIY